MRPSVWKGTQMTEPARPEAHRKERSPGIKLLFALLIAGALVIPLMMVYALVWDRQSQSETAQNSINAGWGGPQVLAGPVIVVPFKTVFQQGDKIYCYHVIRSRRQGKASCSLAAGHAVVKRGKIASITLVRTVLDATKGPLDPECWTD